jgi:VIT1/CCC1 family predicted Fe2+/Mn2+ transporter
MVARSHVGELVANWLDELSSEWVYRTLASLTDREEDGKMLRELADYERKHAGLWEAAIREHGGTVPRMRPRAAHRILVLLARLVGVRAVLPLLHRGEAEGLEVYRHQYAILTDEACQRTLSEILPDELGHEITLWTASGGETEERKREAGRGTMRSAILGANDGLGSVLALVAGVAGATNDSSTVAIAGVAGLVAGAVSMAASNYISVKSEQEAYEARRRIQRAGIELVPEVKKAQLKRHYVRKGFSDNEASHITERFAGNREEMLRELLTEEYGLAEASFENPGRLGGWTGAAFSVAAAVPVLPFLFLPTGPGLLAAVVASMAALFFTGVLRTLVTLEDWWRGGLEMMFIGLGSAVATYGVGLLIGGGFA